MIARYLASPWGAATLPLAAMLLTLRADLTVWVVLGVWVLLTLRGWKRGRALK